MRELENSREILNTIKRLDDTLLDRVKGLDQTLQPLKKYIPESIFEDIKGFDGYSIPKKRALIDHLLKIIDSLIENRKKPVFTPKKPERKEKKVEKRTLEREYFKRVQIKDLKNILKPVEKRALKRIGVKSIEDALFYFPRRYEDKRFKKLSKVKDGETGAFLVEVVETKKIDRGKLKTEVVLKQGDRLLYAYFVHDKPFLFTFFRKGKKVIVAGKISEFQRKKSIIQPEIYKYEEDEIVLNRILPVYSLKGDSSIKITSQTQNHIRRSIYKLLKKYADFYPEIIPEYILKKYNFPDVNTALKKVHFPPEEENLDLLNDFETSYQKRFIFQELFLVQLAQAYRKKMLEKEEAEAIKIPDNFIEDFQKHLPFEMTNAQKRAIQEILKDISKPVPMNRMLQGDVGSGKTVVAAAASLAVALNGLQVAVMAPTEILAQQHYKNFKQFLKDYDIEVVLLTGSMSAKEKKQIYKKIKEGEAKIVIGTHALIQDKVEFRNLSLVIVDEQHRFGVVQRKAITEKSHKVPHVLVMTATPIPRTLTMAYYGDLDLSILNELPKGRKPVKTVLLYDDERQSLYKKIREEIDKGRQVFVVYPLIEESEKIDLKSAEEGYKHWKEAFPDKNVLLLHGKMKQEEKDRIMNEFKEGRANILVSTTVIEVGVDVPNASVMVIEEAHRFGLSQIHQLRGRIGRGQYEGYCFLVIPHYFRRPNESIDENQRQKTLERLMILVKTNDGFAIADKDRELRGTGDIVGTAQSGKFNFGIADLDRPIDNLILKDARIEAFELIEKDPELKNYPELRKILFEKYGSRFDLANIA